MKTFYLAAAATALLLASTAAQAGSNGNTMSFQIQGQKIHIEVPKHCDALSCIQISAPGLSKSSFNLKNLNIGNAKNDADDDTSSAKSAPAPAVAATTPPPPAITAPSEPPSPPPAAAAAPPAPQIVASTPPAPLVHDVIPSAPAPEPAAAPATVTPAPQSAPVAPSVAPAVAANTPLGIWRTENDKGNVRIEQCGANLCGYAVGSGEKILINMRPEESKWVGRIHDPDSGRNYDSTIAMKGSDTLRVQGCAFGGLFCGGQTWKRVS